MPTPSIPLFRRIKPSVRSKLPVDPSEPYSALAAGYDVVMDHIDYTYWAEYVQHLIWGHHPEAEHVLELGCGTGSFAFALQPMGPYHYLATDGSPEMIRVARAKAEFLRSTVQFDVLDFSDFTVDRPVDVIVLLHDGVNYLLHPEQISGFLTSVHRALSRDGILIFDLSTPNNSLNNAALFEDSGSVDAFTYVRRSVYDPERRLHTTEFDLTIEGTPYFERHVQRAYTIAEVEALVRRAGLAVRAVLEDMTDDPADERSERAHLIVGRPDPDPDPRGKE